MSFAGIVSAAVVMIFSKPLLSLYITDDKAAIAAGIERLWFVCAPYFLCGMMEVTTGSIRAMGISLIPMFISVIGVCVFRIVWIATVFNMFGTQESLFTCYPVTWALTIVAQIVAFVIVYKRKKRENELKK